MVSSCVHASKKVHQTALLSDVLGSLFPFGNMFFLPGNVPIREHIYVCNSEYKGTLVMVKRRVFYY